MSNWAPEGFSREVNIPNLLVEYLSPKARQATLAAITRFGVMRQGTWNGCVFNAAGQLEGQNLRNIHVAAAAFDMSPRNVANFIRMWDQYRPVEDSPTEDLKAALEKTLTSFTGGDDVYEVTLHGKSAEEVKAEFNEMVADLDIPVDERSVRQQEFVDSVGTALELLFA